MHLNRVAFHGEPKDLHTIDAAIEAQLTAPASENGELDPFRYIKKFLGQEKTIDRVDQLPIPAVSIPS